MQKGAVGYDGALQMVVEPEAEFKPNYLEYVKWLVSTKRLQGDTESFDHLDANRVE